LQHKGNRGNDEHDKRADQDRVQLEARGSCRTRDRHRSTDSRVSAAGESENRRQRALTSGVRHHHRGGDQHDRERSRGDRRGHLRREEEQAERDRHQDRGAHAQEEPVVDLRVPAIGAAVDGGRHAVGDIVEVELGQGIIGGNEVELLSVEPAERLRGPVRVQRRSTELLQHPGTVLTDLDGLLLVSHHLLQQRWQQRGDRGGQRHRQIHAAVGSVHRDAAELADRCAGHVSSLLQSRMVVSRWRTAMR